MFNRAAPPPLSPVLLAGMALRPVPSAALQPAADLVLRAVLRQRPDMMERLAPFAGRRVLVDPTDLPVAFALSLDRQRPRVSVVGPRAVRGAGPDATVAGPLSALLELLEGRVDGDGLFFARTLAISGDTELVLALRNAVDDAEIDLAVALAGLAGPFAGLTRRAAARLGGLARLAANDLALVADAATRPLAARLEAQAREVESLRRTAETGRRQRRSAAAHDTVGQR